MEVKINPNEELYITDHAYYRLWQRNGWNKRTANRMLKRIYNNGLKPDELKGYRKLWLAQKKYNSNKTEYRIYGDYLYIFDDRTLVTTIPVPCRKKVLQIYK